MAAMLASYIVKVDMGIIIDRDNPIGEGSYATVYSGFSSYGTYEMGHQFNLVAIKVFKPEVLKNAIKNKYVLNEIENGRKRAERAKLQSEHLLPILAVHENLNEHELHVIMPWQEGTLEDLLGGKYSLTWGGLDARNYGLHAKGLWKRDDVKPNVDQYRLDIAGILLPQILSGLESLHGFNIAHRDLKPSNILWTRKRTAPIGDFLLYFALSDFGPTKALNDLDILSSRGSRKYMAPEVYKEKSRSDRGPTTCAVDIWSLFATMVYVLGFYDPASIDLDRSDFKPYDHVWAIGEKLRTSAWEPLFVNMARMDPRERMTAEVIRTRMYPDFQLPQVDVITDARDYREGVQKLPVNIGAMGLEQELARPAARR